MARLANARTNHMTRWVIPVAKRLLIEEACKNAPTQSLGEVAHIEMGQSPDGDSCNDDGDGIPLIGGPADLGLEFPQSTRWTNSPTKLCKPGDIIVCVRATIGEPRWADGIYCLGRGVAGIRPVDKYLLPKFLFFIIEGNEQILQNQGTGTTFKTISKQHLASIQVPMIPVEEQEIIVSFLLWLEQNSNSRPNFLLEAPSLPASLTNQLGIIARIEELAARIEEARGLRREAVGEAEALFEASVGSTFESLHPAEYKPLQELTSKIGSGSTPTGGRGSYPSMGIPFIRSLNVRMRHFQWEDIAFIDKATHDSMKGTWVKPNDVLLNITGASIGRVACAPSDLIEANVNQHVSIIRPIETLCPHYLMYWLSQPAVQKFINEKQKGATRQGFTKAQIEAFEIPLLPLTEQHRIVAYLDDLQSKVNSLKQLQSETSAELDALLPSILDKAFKGEL